MSASGGAGDYFSSYTDLNVHRLMLQDRPRTLAYRKFFETYPELVKGKVVMDVGAGTGILSLFAAAAGAKKVYAVEASDVANICKEVMDDNKFSEVVEVLHCPVESVQLPEGTKVDLLVSEWMGFYLLHESMLESVINARDRFLAPDGVMAPAMASIFLAPVDMTQHFSDRAEEWSNIYGFDFSPVASAINQSEVAEPLIQMLKPDVLRAEPQEVISFDLKTISAEELRKISKCSKFTISKDSLVHGFAVWFSVDFSPSVISSRGCNVDKDSKSQSEPCESKDNSNKLPRVFLSTGPSDPATHWKQTIIFLPQTIMVEGGMEVFASLRMSQDLENRRQYAITLQIDDMAMAEDMDDESDEDDNAEEGEESSDDEDRQRLIAALVAKYNSEHQEEGQAAAQAETQAQEAAARQLEAEVEAGAWGGLDTTPS